MDKLKILIIEDTLTEANRLQRVLLENNYEIAGIAETYTDALNIFFNSKVDIVIIDIFLNGNPEGITFAETITITPSALKPFVFLTSSNDRQIFERAKLTHPFSFLMKPFNELEVLYAIEMAVEKFYEQTDVFLSEEQDTVISTEYMFVKKSKALKKVLLSDIIYIEVEERYCNIITAREKFVIMISLKKMSDFLDKQQFIRTHRNYLVNINMVEEIIPNDNLVIMKGNHKIILSDNYKDLLRKINIFK